MRPLSDRTGHFRNALRFSRSFLFVFGRLPRPVFLRLGRGRGGIGMRRFESAWDVFGIPIVYFPLQTFEFPMFRFPGIKLSTAVRFGAEA